MNKIFQKLNEGCNHFKTKGQNTYLDKNQKYVDSLTEDWSQCAKYGNWCHEKSIN